MSINWHIDKEKLTELLLFLKKLFIYLFLAVLCLRFCARAFSSCGKRGPLFIAVRGPLLLQSTGSRCAGSVIVAHGPSCSTACGIFPDQGSNPCPLHWQADSQPLRHQGRPELLLLSGISWNMSSQMTDYVHLNYRYIDINYNKWDNTRNPNVKSNSHKQEILSSIKLY